MSKGDGGIFVNIIGNPPENSFDGVLLSLYKVTLWAASKRENLKGREKKTFNTASVAYDESTGKFYYGRNGGCMQNGCQRNPILFGQDGIGGILPSESFNNYPVGNCAEVDAINNALNDGAKLENLHLTTIHATKSKLGAPKQACLNCTMAFRGKIKENTTGWYDSRENL